MNAKQLEAVVTRAANLEFELFVLYVARSTKGAVTLGERDRDMFRAGFAAGAAYLAKVNHETIDE